MQSIFDRPTSKWTDPEIVYHHSSINEENAGDSKTFVSSTLDELQLMKDMASGISEDYEKIIQICITRANRLGLRLPIEHDDSKTLYGDQGKKEITYSDYIDLLKYRNQLAATEVDVNMIDDPIENIASAVNSPEMNAASNIIKSVNAILANGDNPELLAGGISVSNQANVNNTTPAIDKIEKTIKDALTNEFADKTEEWLQQAFEDCLPCLLRLGLGSAKDKHFFDDFGKKNGFDSWKAFYNKYLKPIVDSIKNVLIGYWNDVVSLLKMFVSPTSYSLCNLLSYLLEFGCVPDFAAAVALINFNLAQIKKRLNIKFDFFFGDPIMAIVSAVMSAIIAMISMLINMIKAPVECILDTIRMLIAKIAPVVNAVADGTNPFVWDNGKIYQNKQEKGEKSTSQKVDDFIAGVDKQTLDQINKVHKTLNDSVKGAEDYINKILQQYTRYAWQPFDNGKEVYDLIRTIRELKSTAAFFTQLIKMAKKYKKLQLNKMGKQLVDMCRESIDDTQDALQRWNGNVDGVIGLGSDYIGSGADFVNGQLSGSPSTPNATINNSPASSAIDILIAKDIPSDFFNRSQVLNVQSAEFLLSNVDDIDSLSGVKSRYPIDYELHSEFDNLKEQSSNLHAIIGEYVNFDENQSMQGIPVSIIDYSSCLDKTHASKGEVDKWVTKALS